MLFLLPTYSGTFASLAYSLPNPVRASPEPVAHTARSAHKPDLTPRQEWFLTLHYRDFQPQFHSACPSLFPTHTPYKKGREQAPFYPIQSLHSSAVTTHAYCPPAFVRLQLLFYKFRLLTPSQKRNSNLAVLPARPAHRKTARPLRVFRFFIHLSFVSIENF